MRAPDVHVLWHVSVGPRDVQCQMLTCCSGAELQIVENGTITLRELYPSKSDLYDRARELETELVASHTE